MIDVVAIFLLRRLDGFNDQCRRTARIRFTLFRQTLLEQSQVMGLRERLAHAQLDKASIRHQLIEIRIGNDHPVFLSATNAVLESLADAGALVRKVTEAGVVFLGELRDGGVAIWTGNAVYPAGLEAAKRFLYARLNSGKVFYDVMRVNGVSGVVAKWQRLS